MSDRWHVFRPLRINKIFRKSLFGIFALFALVSVSTSVLCIYTVDSHLTQEYDTNGKGIAKAIADSSVDIILNRNLSSLQSLIDQFVETQGISYIYITSETGEFLAHTFVPGVPPSILNSDTSSLTTVHRSLQGRGDFVEVKNPILAGIAGNVHIGMDLSLVSLKIKEAIGRQIYLISIIFVAVIFASVWLLGLAAKPFENVLSMAVRLAREHDEDAVKDEEVLSRKDDLGHLARLFLYYARVADPSKLPAMEAGERSD